MKNKGPRQRLTLGEYEAEIRRTLSYDPETGTFTYKVRCGNYRSGHRPGFVLNGYPYIAVRQMPIIATRIAWFLMTGKWPARRIKLRDGEPTNLSWENLRP